MQEPTKDFSTLRKYTKDHHVRLDRVCDSCGNQIYDLYVKTGEGGEEIYAYVKKGRFISEVYVKPLCWLQGRALYLGDRVFAIVPHVSNGIAGQAIVKGRVTDFELNNLGFTIELTDNPAGAKTYVTSLKNLTWDAMDFSSYDGQEEKSQMPDPTNTSEPMRKDARKDIEIRIEFLEKELGLFRSMLSILDYSERVAGIKNNQPT